MEQACSSKFTDANADEQWQMLRKAHAEAALDELDMCKVEDHEWTDECRQARLRTGMAWKRMHDYIIAGYREADRSPAIGN